MKRYETFAISKMEVVDFLELISTLSSSLNLTIDIRTMLNNTFLKIMGEFTLEQCG